MRGKVAAAHLQMKVLRITPAYAGKSGTVPAKYSGRKDHPRLCGEKYKRDPQKNQNQGSPPPMRGKVGIPRNSAVFDRITPAYAGKSLFLFQCFHLL